jgi:hypothetical protein
MICRELPSQQALSCLELHYTNFKHSDLSLFLLEVVLKTTSKTNSHQGVAKHEKRVKVMCTCPTQTTMLVLLLPKLHVNHVFLKLINDSWTKKYHLELIL